MQVNAATREVTCKVVYYGPGMSGKTTNLKVIHDRAPRKAVGELITLDTHSERTLHFDLLPMDLGQVRGHALRFEFFTVPGQSYYAATRRLVLEGADAVVFVADSRREALDENIDSMNDLLDNLRHHQLPEDLPVVIQYNKQDLPSALKPEQLDPLLNIRRWTRFTAVAMNGQGVLETMQAVATLVVERVKQHPALVAAAGAAAAGAAAGGGASAVVTTSQQRTWLITCYRCQNMLEITNAKQGDLFTCGACGTALECTNLEHGLTRAPIPTALSAGQTQPMNLREGDSGGYSMMPAAAAAGPALNAPSPSGAHAQTPGGMPFEIDGFDQLALLDENIQGRRFRVRERATNQLCRALVLSPTLIRQPGYQPQIEPHARLAAQIKHPHILPLASLRSGRETPVLMSLSPADYESLSHVLARRRTLAPPHALGVARQIALALEEASRHGVVHGWLRPDVVLISADGNVLVDEFGLPKHHRYLVRELAGASAATEYYLAPEHLSEDARSDARSDIFMLGALIFRMITGEGLVTGFNANEALHKAQASGCRTLRQANAQVSRDLDAFFQRMVAVERRDRFQQYRELLEHLDKFGGGAKRATLRLTGSVNSAAGVPGTGSGTRATRPTSRPATSAARRPGVGSGAHRMSPMAGEAYAPPRPTVQRQDSSNAFLIAALAIGAVALIGALLYLNNNGGNFGVVPVKSGNDHPSAFPLAHDLRERAIERTQKPSIVDQVGDPTAAKPAPRPLPAMLQPDKADAKPVATNPSPKPKPSTNPAGAPLNRGDALYQVAQLERDEKFAEALAICDQLAQSKDADTHDSGIERGNDVRKLHDNRRNEVADAVAKAASQQDAATLLDGALNRWGFDGDVEWAQDQLARARARLPAGPAPTVARDPQPTPQPDAPRPAPVDDSVYAAADAALEAALLANQPTGVEQALGKLDANQAPAKALRRKAELWNSRADILGSIIHTRQPKLRLQHPTIPEQWDVTDADRGGVQITSPAGASTKLEWSQVGIADLGRIAQQAADDPKSEGRDHALAAVLLLMGGNTALAGVELNVKGKGLIDDPTAKDLEQMIALKRGREVSDAAKRGDDAIQKGDLKALDDALATLKRMGDKQPGAQSAIAKLEQARTRLAEGKSATSDAALKDEVTFDSIDDLQSFPLRQGVWNIVGGMAVLAGEGGSLARKDLGSARSASVVFQNNGGKGALTVNFRGVRILCDFAANKLTVASREQESRSKEFVFLPKTVQSLYLRENRDAGSMNVEINNGAEVFEVKAGQLTDQLVISAEGGASVAIDEVVIGRDQTRAANDPADAARLDAVRKQTGAEPMGGVYLDPPEIALPSPKNGVQSGLAFPLRADVSSITVDVKGKGNLQFLLGKLGKDGGDYVSIALKPDAQRLVVSWKGALVVKSEQGLVIAENKNIAKDATHLMLLADQDATLPSTPRLNRQ